MPSQAQIAASRANGAQSTGPISPEGKAKSAKNSQRHGLCSKEFVLHNADEKARFDGLFAEIKFTYQANNRLEQEACHHLAVAMWRRRVCDGLEKELLLAIERGEACAIAGGDGLPSLNAINRYRARIARDLKEARAEIAELKAERVKAFEMEIAKAREFSELTQLDEFQNELGEMGFELFRNAVTNEPKVEPEVEIETPKLNRNARRYKEKLARKARKRNK